MRSHRIGTVVAALLITATCTVCGCGENDPAVVSQPAPAPLTSADELAPGAAGVGVMTLRFEDTSRPTMPNGTFPGSPSRVLNTEIWYPTRPDPAAPTAETRDAPLARNTAPYPLILYSHGFMAGRTTEASLARHLASHGYVVAAPDFPLTNYNAPGRPTVTDVVHQPGDLSFLIDRLLSLSADPGGTLAGGIDARRIGAAGLSLGGLTTYLVAFHSAFRDPRIKAAAPLAGPACFVSDAFFAGADLPLLIVHGDIDAIVPYPQNAVVAFAHARAPKYLATVRGGSHAGFSDATDLFGNISNPDLVGCRSLTGTLPDDANFFDLLAGTGTGVVQGDCPLPCQNRTLPAAISGARQRDLTKMSLLSFFDAYLHNDSRSRQFLLSTLAAENAQVQVEADP